MKREKPRKARRPGARITPPAQPHAVYAAARCTLPSAGFTAKAPAPALTKPACYGANTVYKKASPA